MKFNLFIITSIFLLFDSIDDCFSYQYYCYTCVNCNDPFTPDKANQVLCNNGCYKNIRKQTGLNPNVERGCSSKTDGCQNAIYGALGFGTYNYCCWDNYCNGASYSKISLNNLVLSALSSLLFFFVGKFLVK